MKRIAPLLFLAIIIDVSCKLHTPVLLWPGGFPINDYSLFAKFKTTLEKTFPGIPVVLMEAPGLFGGIKGILRKLFLHPDVHIERACKMINSDPRFANGYNAVGAGQSALILRGLVQRCPTPKMKNLISLGGTQQGVFGIPGCTNIICTFLRYAVSRVAYMKLAQEVWAQASYWHDPVITDKYRGSSSFLADINNENSVNTEYIHNLGSLENFILVKFEDDTYIQPKETEWFGFYQPRQSIDTNPLEKFDVYGRLGLNTMNREGKLHFLSLPRDQLSWFLDTVVINFVS